MYSKNNTGLFNIVLFWCPGGASLPAPLAATVVAAGGAALLSGGGPARANYLPTPHSGLFPSRSHPYQSPEADTGIHVGENCVTLMFISAVFV